MDAAEAKLACAAAGRPNGCAGNGEARPLQPHTTSVQEGPGRRRTLGALISSFDPVDATITCHSTLSAMASFRRMSIGHRLVPHAAVEKSPHCTAGGGPDSDPHSVGSMVAGSEAPCDPRGSSARSSAMLRLLSRLPGESKPGGNCCEVIVEQETQVVLSKQFYTR